MLDSYKSICADVADRISGWMNISKNDLLNGYIDTKDTDKFKADGYMAAILYKYWGAISKYYLTSYTSATQEDCFEWLTHAILYAVGKRKGKTFNSIQELRDNINSYDASIYDKTPAWRLGNNSISADKRGPDKVVNQCIDSTRHIYYQSSNNGNRKLNFTLDSIERIEEDEEDYILPSQPSDMVSDLHIKLLVKNAFNHKHYFRAFMIDLIANGDVFDITSGGVDKIYYTSEELDQLAKQSNTGNLRYSMKIELQKTGRVCKEARPRVSDMCFSSRKLAKQIKNIDPKYLRYFSSTYDVDINEAIEACEKYKSITSIKMHQYIDKNLTELKNIIAESEISTVC